MQTTATPAASLLIEELDDMTVAVDWYQVGRFARKLYEILIGG